MKDHNLILRSSQGNQTNTPVFQKRLTQKRSNYPYKLSTEVGMLSEPPLYIACQGYLLLRYPSRLENRQTCGRAPSCFHRRNIWASKRNRVNQRYGRNITGTLNLFLPCTQRHGMCDGIIPVCDSLWLCSWSLSNIFIKGLWDSVRRPWSLSTVVSKGSSKRKISNFQLDLTCHNKRTS